MTRSVAVVGALLVAAELSGSPARIDQAVEPGSQSLFASLHANIPIGQEFVPSAARHVGVRLYLEDRRGPSSDSITVLLRNGSIGGEVVAQVSALPDLAGKDGFVEFRFETPVSLVPGRTYVIEALTSGERWWWMAVGGDPPGPYPSGRPISGGEPREDPWDMVFETLVR